MAKQNPKLIFRSQNEAKGADADQTVTEMSLETQTEEPDFDEQIKQIALADGMASGWVSISRRAPNKPLWSYSGRLPIDDFSLERIRELWGGGDYRARFTDESGQYRANKTFVIDYNSKPDADGGRRERPANEEALSKAIDKLSPNGTQASSQDMMLRMMEMQQKRDDQFLQLMLKSQNDAAKSQSDMMTAMITLVSAQKAPAPPAPGMDMLATLQVFDKLKGQSFDVIEVLKLAREWQEENSGGKNDSWLDKLATLLPMLIGGGMQAQAGAQGQPPPRALPAAPESGPGMPMTARHTPSVSGGPAVNGGATPGAAGAAPGPTLPANPPTPQDMKTLIVFFVRQKLPMLKEFAASEADPYDVAALLSNPVAVPRGQFFELCGMLEKETWIQDLFGGEESIAPFKVWFEKLRQEILDEREAILHPEPDPAAKGAVE